MEEAKEFFKVLPKIIDTNRDIFLKGVNKENIRLVTKVKEQEVLINRLKNGDHKNLQAKTEAPKNKLDAIFNKDKQSLVDELNTTAGLPDNDPKDYIMGNDANPVKELPKEEPEVDTDEEEVEAAIALEVAEAELEDEETPEEE